MMETKKLIECLKYCARPSSDCEHCSRWTHNIEMKCVDDLLLSAAIALEKKQATSNESKQWIPASDPPKEWKNENGDAINYLIYSPGIGVDIGNWIEPAKAWFCLGVPFKVTHWMPLPEPPKEE